MRHFVIIVALMSIVGCGGGGGGDGTGTGSGGDTPPSINTGTNSSNVATLIAAKIACGYNHTLAIAQDSTVSTLGDNTYGQRGDGTTISFTAPVKVSGLNSVVSVAGGSRHSLALKSDGSVWAWGDNTYGQLGDGTTVSKLTPVRVSSLSNIVQIASNFHYSIALRSDGTVWLWGYGYGSTPASMFNLGNVVAVAAGKDHVLALKKDGTVSSWGDNGTGQLGTGQSSGSSATPVQVIMLTQVAKIAAGDGASYAIKNDGTVWSWGYGGIGSGSQLGADGDINQSFPIRITSLAGIQLISSMSTITYAAATGGGIGSVFAWGSYNGFGQIGDGSMSGDVLYPVPVKVISDVVEVAAGFSHAIALKSDGSIYGWGRSSSGQVGNYNPYIENNPTPMLIANFP